MKLRTQWSIAFAAAVVVLLLIGGLSYRRFEQEDAAQRWVAHTHQVMEKLDEALFDTLELGRHGGDREVAARLAANLDGIRALTRDNPRQQAAEDRLAGLVAARVSLLLERGQSSPLPPEEAQGSQELLNQIRSVLLAMRQEEERLERERMRDAQAQTRTARAELATGYALALAILGLTGVSVFREMARRLRSEQQLGAAQKQFRLLFDSNPIPVWVYDLETLSIIDVNLTAIACYGYSREEFVGMKITDIRPPEDVPSLLDSVSRLSDSAEDSGPWRHRKKSGETIDVQIRSYPLKFYGTSARLVTATDITEKRRAEQALRQSEEHLRLILSNIKDYAMITLGPEGRVAGWNGAAEKIMGYRSDEILGKHVSLFYTAEDAAIGKPTSELKGAREAGRFEDDGWRVRKDGSQFWANVVVTPLEDQAGHLRGFVKITRDTTEKRAAEQELLRRSADLETANRELEAFAYSVSHDLRAPLRGIDGFSQALEEDYAQHLDATGKNYLARIRAAASRMGTLIDDLLNLSRVTRAEMHRERIDLSRMAGDIAQELQSAEPYRRVTMKIAAGLTADGDARLVRVALQNLFGNAWKFSAKKALAEIEFGTTAANGGSPYFVRDNGAGFDQAYAARLFGAFQRLHSMEEFPGTGIGLATVQRIVHRHGGKVWAEGTVDRGATVYFTLASPGA